MTYREAIDILTEHNRWRRGDDLAIQHNPKDIGIAIDAAVALSRHALAFANTDPNTEVKHAKKSNR